MDGSSPRPGRISGSRSRVPARRRHLRDAPRSPRRRPTELTEHLARLRDSAAALDIRLGVDARPSGPGSPSSWRPRAEGPAATPRSGSPPARLVGVAGPAPARTSISRRRSPSRRGPSSPPPADHLERGLSLVVSSRAPRPGEPGRDPQDDVAARTMSTPGSRRAAPAPRRPVPHDRPGTCPNRRRPTCSSSAAPPTASTRSRRRRSTARSCPGRRARGCCAGRAARVSARSRAGSRPTSSRRPRGVRLLVGRGDPARHPVQRPPIGAGVPGPWTLRARADREAVFGEPDAAGLRGRSASR